MEGCPGWNNQDSPTVNSYTRIMTVAFAHDILGVSSSKVNNKIKY